MSVNLISLSSSEGGSFGEPGDKNWVEFHEGEVIVFKENLEIGTIMSCSFKSYPFFLGRIKGAEDTKEDVEAWLIISEREGVSDDFTMFIHNETVMLEFGQIKADEIGHK